MGRACPYGNQLKTPVGPTVLGMGVWVCEGKGAAFPYMLAHRSASRLAVLIPYGFRIEYKVCAGCFELVRPSLLFPAQIWILASVLKVDGGHFRGAQQCFIPMGRNT